ATAGALDSAVRRLRADRLAGLADKVDRLATWSDLILPEDMLDSLRELIARVRHRDVVLGTWGMERVSATARALTALFQGGPGTGKTLAAGVLARELGYELYCVDISRVMSRWLGETEKNLARIFDGASDGETILLFDEADTLFGRRTEVKSSHDRYANVETNYLLQRLDSWSGIAILTTNFGASIDPAFRRRLTLQLQFPFPDDAERTRLWQAHLPPSVPVRGDLDLAALAARFKLSGGYIRNAALRACYLAVGEGSPLTADHLIRAIKLEYRDMAKVAEGGRLE
ncbi:MAG TPA: AAA family ATPase, partial [Kofleriaceae bacterium]